jgi:hypothetical protein
MPSTFFSVYINLFRHLNAHVKTSHHELPMPLTLFNLHFHFLQNGQIGYPVHYVPVSLSEVKRQGSKVNHSSPPSAQVKNECSYTSTPPHMPSRREQEFALYFVAPCASWLMLISSSDMFDECICFSRRVHRLYGFRTCTTFLPN